MDYSSFIQLVKHQDSRNVFEENAESANVSIPKELKGLYLAANPKDVEIVLDNLCSIKLYSQDELEGLQKEYDIDGESFVFATLEGDPIFLKDGMVYTAPHGVGEWRPELMNNSFEEFIKDVITKMKK